MISNDAEMAITQGEDISTPVVDNQGEVGEISTQVVDNKISYEKYKERFEIDRERLNVVSASTKLGEGYFGLVLRAELTRNDSDEKLMVATKGDNEAGEITINDEYNNLSSLDLVLFAYQISNGMEHLTNIPCVHRDLALRNILITQRKIIRIGDFGLAMKYEDKNYFSESPISKVPCHSAPEIVNETTPKYTEKSDIWSYGLCLFQLFALSTETDFNSKENGEKFMENNNPLYCRREILEFLEMCWDVKPRRRPNFQTCVYTFKCELNRFSDQIHKEIEEKLNLEARQQLELETWRNSEVSHEHTE
ncbi:hypothetical protein B9Z55_020850 [Caenorhabditis nigoni]|nr:hypothetical protein B9Z55_020850 [Caenorhabditis nigoni]